MQSLISYSTFVPRVMHEIRYCKSCWVLDQGSMIPACSQKFTKTRKSYRKPHLRKFGARHTALHRQVDGSGNKGTFHMRYTLTKTLPYPEFDDKRRRSKSGAKFSAMFETISCMNFASIGQLSASMHCPKVLYGIVRLNN